MRPVDTAPRALGWTALGFGALALLPLLGHTYATDWACRTMIYALLALSLEWLVGGVGLVCFGQAAFFGVGAYATVLLVSWAPTLSLLSVLPLAMAGACACALAVGALALRTRGAYFIMITLAFAQMGYSLVHDTPWVGGSDGLYLAQRPQLLAGLTLDTPVQLYGLAWVCLVCSTALLALLRRSRFGHALAGIRVNELRMRACGFSTDGYKLAAFGVSGALAGLAGVLFALKDGFVTPQLLGWHLSGTVLVMVIFGGLGHLRGALLGAFAWAGLQEAFQSEAWFGSWAQHWPLSLGVCLVLSVALLPQGLLGLPALWRRARGQELGHGG